MEVSVHAFRKLMGLYMSWRWFNKMFSGPIDFQLCLDIYAGAGGAYLELPPILKGYTGELKVNNTTGTCAAMAAALKDVPTHSYRLLLLST